MPAAGASIGEASRSSSTATDVAGAATASGPDAKYRREVQLLLDGIPEHGNALGRPNAPVTLQYFGDLECPICHDFTLGALRRLIADDVRSGRLKIEYRSLSTATGSAEATGAEPKGTFGRQVAAYAPGGVGSRSPPTPPAAKTLRGTSSCSPTESREKRTAAMSPNASSGASPNRCRA